MTDFIVLGGSVIAVALFLVLPACWLTSRRHEKRADKYWADLGSSPATNDPQEWTGPLHTGSRSAERRMFSHLRKIGYLPFKRTSERTRRLVVAADKYRPRRRWLRTPRPAPQLESLPASDTWPGEHDAPLPVDELLPGDGLLDDEAEFSYSGDNTTWTKMRTELFAMLNADGRS